MAQYSVNWSAKLSAVSGAVSVGHCLVSTPAGYVVGTTANRATYGRCSGVAATSGVAGTSVPLIEAGPVRPSVSALSAGTASWVRVSATGTLERCTPASGDDLVGRCLADGTVHLVPGVFDSDNYAGGGGGGTGSNLGAGAEVFKDVSGGALRHRTLKSTGTPAESVGSVVQGSDEIELRPLPPGHYNVVDYGAVGDNATDNTAAFHAAIAAMEGLIPADFAADTRGGVLHVPPGRYYFADNLHITRQMILRGCGTGGGRGSSFLIFAAGKGVFIERYNTGPVGTGAGDWSIVENLDITSTNIALVARPVSDVATLGLLVYADTDNRFYFECTTAGTTDAADPFLPDVNTAERVVTDGTVEWTTRHHTGVTLKARAHIRNCFIFGFTNAGMMVAAAYNSTDDPSAAANGWQAEHLWIAYCGLGLSVHGNDSNGGSAFDISVDNPGYYITNTAGYGVWDKSFLSSAYIGCQIAGSTGHSYKAEGVTSASTFINCYTEGDCPSPLILSPATFIGGSQGSGVDAASTGLILLPGYSSNINTRDQANDTQAGLNSFGVAAVHWFSHGDENGGQWERKWGAPNAGEWGQAFGVRTVTSIMSEGSDAKGNWRDVHGRFMGLNSSEDIFIGPASALTDKYTRGGHHLFGDQFWFQGTGVAGSFQGWTVAVEGYRGVPWAANTTYGPSTVYGYVADMVEPVDHDPLEPAAGGKVFRATTYGLSHPTDTPDWASAVVAGVDTVVDNEVTWLYVGDVAQYNRIGRIETASGGLSPVTTADATPVYVTLATLAVGDVKQIDVVATVAKADATVRQNFKLSGLYYGAAGPTATIDGSLSTTATGTGTAAVTLDLSGATVRLKITGIAATTLVTTYDVTSI